ncbi:hypothetical protein Tco_1092844 [Tanacetum coccineum]|uniref:Uncharacterized protein n=1 Tax=Tanacetum coccineum TaxID=301880 RepID=A0ABQ5IB24_9ASTR
MKKLVKRESRIDVDATAITADWLLGINLKFDSLKTSFSNSGLKSTMTDLGDGTTIHCWIPKTKLNGVTQLQLGQNGVTRSKLSVCLEMKDLDDGLFPVKTLEEAAEILLPQTPEKMKELMKFTFVKPPVKLTPNCILVDFIDEMNKEHVEEKRELIIALAKDRKLSEIPKISQEMNKEHVEEKRELIIALAKDHMVVIKGTGHAYLVEKPKEFYRHLKSFLIPEVPPIPSLTTPPTDATPTITNASTTAWPRPYKPLTKWHRSTVANLNIFMVLKEF